MNSLRLLYNAIATGLSLSYRSQRNTLRERLKSVDRGSTSPATIHMIAEVQQPPQIVQMNASSVKVIATDPDYCTLYRVVPQVLAQYSSDTFPTCFVIDDAGVHLGRWRYTNDHALVTVGETDVEPTHIWLFKL